MSAFPLLVELVRRTQLNPGDERVLVGISELVARFWALRTMSIGIAAALEDGQSPDVEAALVKDMGTCFESEITEHARDRKQFSRFISQYQIIQSYLAAMAGELCAASAIVETALAAAACGDGNEEIAAAKIRVGQAARTITSLSHQIHGAVGFTLEYPLNL